MDGHQIDAELRRCGFDETERMLGRHYLRHHRSMFVRWGNIIVIAIALPSILYNAVEGTLTGLYVACALMIVLANSLYTSHIRMIGTLIDRLIVEASSDAGGRDQP